ncbi:MAG TPA: DUF1947 domain-containing protein [Thermoplasmatales archaeon]|nr:DUF1947 domain-containing protein [Thermoplasmatales archaeon]
MKHRHTIKTKERKRFISQINEFFPEINISPKSNIETAMIEDYAVFLVDGEVEFILKNDVFIPTIPFILKHNLTSNFVTVDEGAIRFIANGADIMIPGIVDADLNIKKGDPVWVKEEKHGKPLATGIALTSGEEMKNKNRGKAVETLHYVGDKLWKHISKSL